MTDEQIYEHLLGLRAQLRGMLGQVSFLIDEMKQTASEETSDPAPSETREVKVFGSKSEIANVQAR